MADGYGNSIEIQVDNVAATMLAALFPRNRTRKSAIAGFVAAIDEPGRIERVAGFEDVFHVCGDDLRFIFDKRNDKITIRSVQSLS